MLSKSEKNMFYYLGLSLLVLIVLGVLFGVSSVKESFGGDKTSEQKACENAGKDMAKTLLGQSRMLKWKDPLKKSIMNEIRNRCAGGPAAAKGPAYAIHAVGRRAFDAGDDEFIKNVWMPEKIKEAQRGMVGSTA